MPILPTLLFAPLLLNSPIESRFAELEVRSKGKLGAAVVSAEGAYFHRKEERFSLQSVMKLMVAMTALDQVDRGRWKRDERFTFRRSDLSLSHQPIVERLGNRSQITVTLADCVDLMVTQSCSGAADFMIRKMGGPSAVNAFLRKNGVNDMSVDRQERDLQTEIGGIRWRQEFVDEAKIEAAYAKVPMAQQDAAFARYLADPRDTTTPAAMAKLLQKLLRFELLSPASTRYLLGVMERTVTGPDRLRAGVPKGWTLAHKTGTSTTHRGVNGATNDVGIARNKTGGWVILVALLRESPLPAEGRAAILAEVARTALKGR